MKKINFRREFALLTMVTVLSASSAFAAEKYHHMKEAHRKMEEALNLMKAAPHEYNGFRAKSEDLLGKALEENKKAIDWAESKHIE